MRFGKGAGVSLIVLLALWILWLAFGPPPVQDNEESAKYFARGVVNNRTMTGRCVGSVSARKQMDGTWYVSGHTVVQSARRQADMLPLRWNLTIKFENGNWRIISENLNEFHL
jgi:hypothetical protein